ncbi:SusC/RagA family TonB-linked outer membrane protein [Sediminibacterium soli]|uniref:SusC/RagA family TonB-linked outer membrane protein n=1 Tax=Sediminibacterium soli TaxID=2698829 RepID=UPI00137A90C4|nr:SusC/RagA family TonB-linked outer membrane protein [Sediminibacterium soli]NCI48176.1 SusC/RagA family TonB-linked outer membrane protein [Sediminibacterium soli]
MNRNRLAAKWGVLLLLLCAHFLSVAQERTVTGKVTDQQTGKPMEGVNIRIKNTKNATITNDKGEFSVKVPSSESVISVTYVGYMVYETKVGNGASLRIEMTNADKPLEDVIIVGYGTQKRSHLTGSVGTVDMKSIQDVPVGNLSEALKGQIVGVGVSGGFSRPGEPASITIRNPIYFSKDGGSKEPLYVIDDIIRTKLDFDLLDATEVENITVLKDAAAAIYGILGSNGVIMIKTRRGKVGASTINYNASYGVSDAPVMPKMMNGYQQAVYLNNYNAGSKNWDTTATAALAAYYTQDELDYFKTHNYNWLQQAWHASHEMRQTLNISGGSDKATYFAGFTYNEQNSNFDGLGYKRYSFRASSDIKLTTGLKLGLALSGNLSDKKNTFNKQGNESLDNDWRTLVGESQFNPPFVNGLPILIPGAGTSSNINTYHYFAVHNLDNYTSSYNTGLNFQGQLSYEVPFIKGLRAAVNYNKNIANSWGKQYGTKYDVYQFNTLGNHGHILDTSVVRSYTWSNGDRVRLNPTMARNYQVNATINYDRSFGQHQIAVLLGYEQSESFADGVAGQVDGVVAGGLDNQNFATGNQASNETISEGGRLAYIGRLNYNYANKYLVEVQFRADASINFAPENRWGYFPSVSGGWVLSEESFFKRLFPKVNYFKIRGSVGWLGLDATKPYQWLRSYTIQTGKAAVFGSNTDRGLAVVSNVDLANRAVHWDNVDKYNAGIDARFLNGRLGVSIDGFIDRRSNMLSNLTSAPSILIGTAIPSENFGRANTFGYEISANWKDRISRDWSYNVTANFSWNDNKVLVTDVAKGNIGTYLDPTGRSSDLGFLGYRSLGIFRTQADVDAFLSKNPGYTIFGQAPKPGMLYFQDIRGPQDPATGLYGAPDGIITTVDQDYLKPKAENHYGLGINWGLAYKSLSLNVVMGMSWGGIGSVEGPARKVGNAYSNRPAFWSDHWTPTNTGAAYPSPFYTGTYDVATDFWWRSSFSFRVTTLNLAYTLPQQVLRKLGMNSGRLYLTAINPFNFFNPYDYKDNANGSYDVFPQLRSVSMGLNVNF